jgi:hypothetical protein
MADYCSDPFMYNNIMTNTTYYPENGTHMWNDSGIYSSNSIESLSLLINDSYRDSGYVNINFIYQSDKINIFLIVVYSRATILCRFMTSKGLDLWKTFSYY